MIGLLLCDTKAVVTEPVWSHVQISNHPYPKTPASGVVNAQGNSFVKSHRQSVVESSVHSQRRLQLRERRCRHRRDSRTASWRRCGNIFWRMLTACQRVCAPDVMGMSKRCCIYCACEAGYFEVCGAGVAWWSRPKRLEFQRANDKHLPVSSLCQKHHHP